MTKDIFDARRKQLEARFFHAHDAQLVDKIKAVFHKKIDKEQIRQTTGITDEVLLDNLVALNLSGELIAAFRLYPLVEIAWADGEVDEREVDAVLSAAEHLGVAPGSAAHTMLENALKRRPRDDSRKLWYLYANELRKVLTAQELGAFRDNLLSEARRVAAASGGILNIAFNVSGTERKVLAAIEDALTPD